MLPVPSTNNSSAGAGLLGSGDLISTTPSNIGSSEGGHLNLTNIQVLPDLNNGSHSTLSHPISSDINSNSDIKIRTDLFNAREEPTDEIEVLGVKELVELFLEELSDRISQREVINYFSAFGEVIKVDLMENLYGRNSGLGIVEIKIDEKNKRKLLELFPKINSRRFKVMFKEGIVVDDPTRLHKRFGDNSSKLRLRRIRRDVTAHDIRE